MICRSVGRTVRRSESLQSSDGCCKKTRERDRGARKRFLCFFGTARLNKFYFLFLPLLYWWWKEGHIDQKYDALRSREMSNSLSLTRRFFVGIFLDQFSHKKNVSLDICYCDSYPLPPLRSTMISPVVTITKENKNKKREVNTKIGVRSVVKTRVG